MVHYFIACCAQLGAPTTEHVLPLLTSNMLTQCPICCGFGHNESVCPTMRAIKRLKEPVKHAKSCWNSGYKFLGQMKGSIKHKIVIKRAGGQGIESASLYAMITAICLSDLDPAVKQTLRNDLEVPAIIRDVL